MATATATRKPARKSRPAPKPVSAEVQAERDAEREAKIVEVKATFDQAVLGLNTEAGWEEMVESVADFGAKYSFGNQLLILAQAMEKGFNPQLVMSFNAWKKRGRIVKSGPGSSLKVWAPARYKLSAEDAEKLASKSGRRWDGKPIYQVRGWKLESVFDISQTEGDDVELPPSILRRYRVAKGVLANPVLLTGDDTTDSLALVIREIEARGYRFERHPAAALGHANGDTDPAERLVRVRDDVDDAQAVKTAVHELAHIVCKHVDDMDEYRQHRGRMETEAESVAHIVLKCLGLDTDAYSAPYVAGWSKGDPEVLKAAATTVVEAAKTILTALEPQEVDEAA